VIRRHLLHDLGAAVSDVSGPAIAIEHDAAHLGVRFLLDAPNRDGLGTLDDPTRHPDSMDGMDAPAIRPCDRWAVRPVQTV
jgi:hypothetical protein